jgi:hypothetical protein
VESDNAKAESRGALGNISGKAAYPTGWHYRAMAQRIELMFVLTGVTTDAEFELIGRINTEVGSYSIHAEPQELVYCAHRYVFSETTLICTNSLGEFIEFESQFQKHTDRPEPDLRGVGVTRGIPILEFDHRNLYSAIQRTESGFINWFIASDDQPDEVVTSGLVNFIFVNRILLAIRCDTRHAVS